MSIVTDTFERTRASGWGSADTGGAYTLYGVGNGAWSVGSGRGQIAQTVNSSTDSQVAALESVSVLNSLSRVTFRLLSLPSSSNTLEIDLYARWRGAGGTRAYQAAVLVGTTSVQLQLWRIRDVTTESGYALIAETTLPLTIAAATDYTVALRVVQDVGGSDMLAAKLWATSASEPLAWPLVARYRDTTSGTTIHTLGSPAVGLSYFGSAQPVAVLFDNLTVESLPAQIVTCGPLIFLDDTFARTTTAAQGWLTSTDGVTYTSDANGGAFAQGDQYVTAGAGIIDVSYGVGASQVATLGPSYERILGRAVWSLDALPNAETLALLFDCAPHGLVVRVTPAGATTFQITHNLSSPAAPIMSGPTIAAGVRVAVEWERTYSGAVCTIRGRWWLSTASPPSGWLTSLTVTNQYFRGGVRVGVGALSNSASDPLRLRVWSLHAESTDCFNPAQSTRRVRLHMI